MLGRREACDALFTLNLFVSWCLCHQSSPTPYYTFYYDTGFSDEEEIEEQVLRNTVNSEALMTAFHQNLPGTNGNKVGGVSHIYNNKLKLFWSVFQDYSLKFVPNPFLLICLFVVRAWRAWRSDFGRIISPSSAVASTCFALRRSRSWLPWGSQSHCEASFGWRYLVRRNFIKAAQKWSRMEWLLFL